MTGMAPAKPSLELLRSLTDEHVLRALMEQRRSTRAELAALTGLSKPTVSDSVRRLTEAGLLVDTGERTTGRGRIGSYYGLADQVGRALVVDVAPAGIVAQLLDAHGDVLSTATVEVARPARPAQVIEALTAAATRAQEGVARRPRLAVISAADPVDRSTGRLVHLPDSPFLLGELSPADVLAGLVDGPVLVDNDVNWAARAERDVGDDPPLDDFAYVHLGEGLGCAVVNDGVVRRGHDGLVGEIAHVLTTGPDGRALPFIEVFGALHLRRPGSTAIDVDALLDAARADAAAATLAPVRLRRPRRRRRLRRPRARRHRRDVGHGARRPRRRRRRVRAAPPPRPAPGRAVHRRALARRRAVPRDPRAPGGHRHQIGGRGRTRVDRSST